MQNRISISDKNYTIASTDFDKTLCKTDMASIVNTAIVAIFGSEPVPEELKSVKTTVDTAIKNAQATYQAELTKWNNIEGNTQPKPKNAEEKWIDAIEAELKQNRGMNENKQRTQKMEDVLKLLTNQNLTEEEKYLRDKLLLMHSQAEALERMTREDGGDQELKSAVANFLLSDNFNKMQFTKEEIEDATITSMAPRNYLSGKLADEMIKNLNEFKQGSYKNVLDQKMVEILKKHHGAVTSYNNNSKLMRATLNANDLQNVPIVYGSLSNCVGSDFGGCRPLLKFIHGLAVAEYEQNIKKLEGDIHIDDLIDKLPENSFARRLRYEVGNLTKQDKIVSRNGYKEEIKDLRLIFTTLNERVLGKSQNPQEDLKKLNALYSKVRIIDDHHKTILPFAKNLQEQNGAVSSKEPLSSVKFDTKYGKLQSPTVAVPNYAIKTNDKNISSIHGHQHQTPKVLNKLNTEHLKDVQKQSQTQHVQRIQSAKNSVPNSYLKTPHTKNGLPQSKPPAPKQSNERVKSAPKIQRFK